MTIGMASKMAQPEPLAAASLQISLVSRPRLLSHHSNSLPATPYHHPRKLSFNSRSPSPEKANGHRSPRSVRSESESDVRKGFIASACKYETGMAHSRRRIPYSVGGDQLERAKTMPKKYLNPAEEGKLSGDMRELYDRILPSKESDERRAKFKQKLELILNEQWPGNNIKVHVFGSSGNLLCSSDSDVDICITTPMKALEQVCLLAKALADHGMERVVCVPHAKVPIVKIWDPELELACDMNVNNTLALENTRMIKTYVEIDERVRPLAMIVKHWTKRRILNDAALGGTLSSYTWICMILNFLQTRNPPVLPCLHQRPHQRLLDTEGKPSSFADDLTTLRGFGEKNKETIGDLLFHFFRRYAHEIDYEKNVLSVREGKLISKEAKKWHLMQNNRLCVEEPFNTERNLGNTADDISFRGVHLELRRAFDLISEANLKECIKQYEFPAVEEKFWEKPPPRPIPVLSRSRSQSQSGRGGKTGVGTRGGKPLSNQPRTGQQARRASSAAAMNKFVGPHAGARNLSSQDHALQAHFQQLHLHDQLINKYQLLQAQEHELRVIQAQTHAHAQAHGVSSPLSLAQHTPRDFLSRSAALNQASLSAPLRGGSFPYPLVYPSVHGNPHQIVHTNPPSPSMMPAQPELRRKAHRSSAADSDSNLNLRSHSQPARPIPSGFAVQKLQALPVNGSGFFQYQQVRQQQQQQFYNALDVNQGQQRHFDYPHRRTTQGDTPFEDNLPKEYVGYYVHGSPPSRPYREDPTQRMLSYNDSYCYRGVAPGISRLFNASRSPSPSPALPSRDRSFSVRSASSAPPGPIPYDRAQNPKSSHRSSGPIIVDGSGGWELHEVPRVADSTSYSDSLCGVTSVSEAQVYDASLTATNSPYQGQWHHDPLSRENTPSYNHVHPTPEPRRIVETSRNSIIEPLMRRASTYASDPTTTQATKRSEQVTNGNGLGIDIERPPKRQVADHGTEEIAQRGFSPPNVDTKPDVPTPRYDYSPKPVPLLSPVREVRTPSPTANRKEDIFTEVQYTGRFRSPVHLEIPSFSSLMNGKQNHIDALSQTPNGGPPNLTESPKGTPQPLTNGWQQPSKKGKKSKSKSQSLHMPILVPGEPWPVNEAERKGG